MKAYIVFGAYNYEEDEILGVYSSNRKALDALAEIKRVRRFDHYRVKCFIVNNVVQKKSDVSDSDTE